MHTQSRKEKRKLLERQNKNKNIKKGIAVTGMFQTLLPQATLAATTDAQLSENQPNKTTVIVNNTHQDVLENEGVKVPEKPQEKEVVEEAAIVEEEKEQAPEEEVESPIVEILPPITHTVVAGETLNAIAASYAVTVEQIVEWNAIENPNLIFAGQVFIVSNPNTTAEIISEEKEEEPSSNLNGFELPTLSKFENQNQAAFLTESLDKLNAESLNSVQLVNQVYANLFGMELGETVEDLVLLGEEKSIEEVAIGDLVFFEEEEETKNVGLYLGQERYITSMKNEETQTDEVRIESFADKLPSFALGMNNEYINFGELQLTEHGAGLIASYPVAHEFTVNETTEAFIEEIGEDAREIARQNDLFASVMIAQAILESASGTSGLSTAPNYNLFGVKGSYQGESVAMATFEDDGTGELYQIDSGFRRYPSYRESLEDYAALLKGGIIGDVEFYRPAWKSDAKNYLSATAHLTGRYATDTQYDNKLNSIIATYNLTRFDVKGPRIIGELANVQTDNLESFQHLLIAEPFDDINRNLSGSYPVGQCTWYAFNRIAQLGGAVGAFMGNGGDWGTTGTALGYHVSVTPSEGTAVSFAPGVAGADATYGHVAFVEAVGTDGILISEQNVVGLGVTSYRFIPNEIAISNGVTYVTPN